MPAKKGNCQNLHISGTNIDTLSSALSNTNNNYSFVGNYVCDSDGNCGRGIGAMQFMSYRPDVRKVIASKSGGKEFLAKLDQEAKVTGDETLQYFPPTEQQSLIESETNNLLSTASQQTDPNTGRSFIGDRLIERAAQMQFVGLNISVDKAVSDVSGENSVKSYGEKANSKYLQNLQSMGCS